MTESLIMDENSNVWTIILLAVGSFSGSLWVYASKQKSDTITMAQRHATLFAGFLFGSIFGAVLGHISVERWFSEDAMVASFVYGAAASICTLLSGGFARGLIEIDIASILKETIKKKLGVSKNDGS